MGYLGNDGQTLTYEESLKYKQKIKQDGVIQFLQLYKQFQNYNYKDTLKNIQINPNILPIYWGDEIEGHVVQINNQDQSAKLAIDLNYLFEKVENDKDDFSFNMMPEYGSWMIETTPSHPYFTVIDFNKIIQNVNERTKKINQYLHTNQKVLYTSTYPMLGNIDQEYFHIENKGKHENTVTQSLFIDDRIINNHPRFPTLSMNIRSRRQEKVNISVPMFRDINTSSSITEYDPVPYEIYMDAMAFGMGSSCIQTTFSTKNISHARRLYDQMSILSPLFLALTASSPIFRGKLANIDTRWDIIAASVDCRTPEERNPESDQYIPKSRYDSISYYISNEKSNLAEYNDLKFSLNQEIMQFTREKSKEMGMEIDEKLITHLGFLFIRDPLVLFEKKLDVDNSKETLHFENIQSTNWNSVRLKPPPSIDSEIGWRFEFRTMESQITSDENAAFMILSHIFVRLFYQSDDLNFYIPISKKDENFKRAKEINSILTQKFFFRVNIFDSGLPIIEELTLHEIFFGKETVFEGFYKISSEIWSQIVKETDGSNEKVQFEKVWQYIKERTSGKRKTVATWIREFVQNNPLYKKDSNISNQLAYELIHQITQITEGNILDPNFAPIF